MAEPVLVVHGVANRDPEAFNQTVAKLQATMGDNWKLIPVFWGDIAGQNADITDCLPVLEEGQFAARSAAMIPRMLAVAPSGTALTNQHRARLMAGAPTTMAMAMQPMANRKVQIIAEELDNTRFLKQIDDEELLKSLSELIDVAEEGNEPLVRPNAMVEHNLLGFESVRDRLRRAVHGLDDVVGKLVQKGLGKLNQQIRASLAANFALFAGDIFVYEANKAHIQARVREAIAEHATGFGTDANPINVMGHSLGGLVLFDLAIGSPDAADRLFYKSFTTFGSQSAFFQIIDPRKDVLAIYSHGNRIKLPPTIKKWTNLWDPMDPLAFTASTVFELADGSSPEEVPVADSFKELLDNKFWTHSIYWTSTELAEALKRTLVL